MVDYLREILATRYQSQGLSKEVVKISQLLDWYILLEMRKKNAKVYTVKSN